MRAACVVVLGLGLAGCLDSLPPEEHGTSARGACTALEGKRFQSTSEGECGLGPDGPASCAWQLRFTADDGTRSQWTWSHSDVGESGTVTCADGTITGMYSGSYDPATRELTWDDRTYAPVP